MRYRKIVLAITAIAGFSSTALAIDENEMRSAIQRHICPTQKIDVSGLPDLHACEQIQDLAVASKCQDRQLTIYYRAIEYNKLYGGCHKNDSRGDSQLERARSKALGADAAVEREQDSIVQQGRKETESRERAREELRQKQDGLRARSSGDSGGLDRCEQLKRCDAGCGPASDATAGCWNGCLARYGRC